MILHAADVMARCVERGYSWDEIKPCLLEDLGNGWYEVDVDHPAYPRQQKAGTEPPKMGLGDLVAAGLTAIGAKSTPSRLARILPRFSTASATGR